MEVSHKKEMTLTKKKWKLVTKKKCHSQKEMEVSHKKEMSLTKKKYRSQKKKYHSQKRNVSQKKKRNIRH